MRNFNALSATVMTSAAILGGNAVSASVAAADQPPDQFPACVAALASPAVFLPTNSNVAVISELGLKVDPGNSKQTVNFTMGLAQVNLLNTGGENPVACEGNLTVEKKLQLKAGTFTETLAASTQIVFNNNTLQDSSSPEAAASGSFSFARACKQARKIKSKGQGNSVELLRQKTVTYSDTGHPSATVTGYSDQPIALSCSTKGSKRFLPDGVHSGS
jgi:hypothetical protein